MDLFLVMKAFLRILWVLINNIYCISAYILCILILRPLLWFKVTYKLFWDIEGVLYRWLFLLMSEWPWSAGYTIAETGDDISDLVSNHAIVMSNHQSTADVPILVYSLTNKGDVANNVYWIMDHIFKYTNFGLVAQCHGDFFILQGKETRQLQLEQLRDHVRQVSIPRKRKWVCLFPEGGFLYKRKASSQKYANKNGYPLLEHVTLPRVGAMKILLKELDTLQNHKHISNGVCSAGDVKTHSNLKWVIDITIAYPNRRPLDLLQIILGIRPPCRTVLHYRKYPISQIPQDDDGLLNWMYDRFVEKEELLSQFYNTGKFPSKSDEDSKKANGHVIEDVREVKLCNVYLAGLHLLYAAILLFHFKWMYFIYSCF